MTEWYVAHAGNQGLICDIDTGENIAVTYDKKNALLVSLSPTMKNLLRRVENIIPDENSDGWEDTGQALQIGDVMREIRCLLYELEEGE